MKSAFKKVVLFCSLSFLAGSAVFAFSVSKPAKEIDATNIGSDSLFSVMLSTNGTSASSMTLTTNGKTYAMQKLQQVSSSSMFAVNILASDLTNNMKFKGGSVNATTSSTDTVHHSYNLNGTSTVTYSTSQYAVNQFLESSVSTRRLWFTLTSNVNGFIGVYTNGQRHLLAKVHNNIDDRDYYYVDIPVNTTEFSMSYVAADYTGSINALVKATYSSARMHAINLLDPVNKTLTEYTPTGLDQYFINEYLRGFSSCSDSDINGYNAYPYISNIVSHFSSYESGTLSDVSQDDYLKSDYDNGYISTSIRGGMSVTAQEKLDEIQHNYLAHQNKLIINNDDSNKNIWIIVVSSLLTITAVSSYLLIKRKKNN